MPRLPLLRAALAGLLTLVLACLAAVGPVAGTAAAGSVTAGTARAGTSNAAGTGDPLEVHIDTVSSVLPRQGNVVITGTVTNVSQDTFTRINLHTFSSQSPLTDATTLAASAAIDPTEYVGPRVTDPGTFDTVDVLAPGESAIFGDSVPVELLGIPDEPGVYWIGIHALGDGGTPRDDVADGRARTFIPLLPAGADSGDVSHETAIVLPLRSRVWFDDEGRVGGTERWARWLAEGGRLDAALDVADTAGATPYNWLVDPAILVALARLATGNPPRTIEPDPTVEGQEPPPAETPGGSGSTPSQTLTPSAPVPTEERSEEEQALATAASEWTNRFLTTAAGRTILTLPFGDLDVSAAVRHSPERFVEAVERSARVMSDLGVSSEPTLAPENDVLSPEALAAAPDGTTILLGDNAFASPPGSRTSVVRLLGHKVLVTSTGAESGGPGPTAPDDPLALRQRLLSEAALRVASDDPAPLVVTVPTRWEPADAASFFSGLGEPWLDVVDVLDVAARSASGLPSSSLAYTETDLETELDAASFAAATDVSDTAAVMEEVLSMETTIEAQVRDELLVTLSQQHSSTASPAVAAATRTADALRANLAEVRIEAPPAVTLSSDSGPVGATLVNGLDQPVTVRIQAATDGDLTLDVGGTRELGPDARSPVRFEATTSQPGVHNIRLSVTTLEGTPIGSYDDVPIRAAGVSALIWIIMAGAALVLFGAIGYRLPRQIRARREELAAAEAATEADDVRPLPQGAP